MKRAGNPPQIKLYDAVILLKDFPGKHLEKGYICTVDYIWEDGHGHKDYMILFERRDAGPIYIYI